MNGLPALLSALLLLSITPCYSQDWSSIQVLGASGTEQCQGLEFLSDGSYIVAGAFDPSLTLNGETFLSNGENDLILTRFDSDGNLIWANHYGSTLDDRMAKLLVLENDHFLGIGTFWVSMELGSITLEASLNPKAIFIAEWNAEGEVLWAKTINGDGLKDINDLSIDSSGNLYLAGYFGSTLQYEHISLSANGQTDLFLLKLSATGEAIWGTKAGWSKDVRAVGVSVQEDEQLFVSGFYNDTLIIANDTLTAFSFDDDTFLAQFSPGGVPLGAKKLGGVFDDQVVALLQDAEGALYQVGYLIGVIGIEEGWSIESTSTLPNTYIIKFSSDGTPLWAKTFGDAALFQPTAAKLIDDHLFLAGVFEQSHTIGSNTITATNGTTDGFFMSLTLDGAIDLLQSIPGTGRVLPSSLAVDNTGNSIVGGSFEQSILVPFESTALGDFDLFLLGKQMLTSTTESTDNTPMEVVFPNPSDGLLYLPKHCSQWYVKIYNDLGQLQLQALSDGQLHLEQLQAGRYHIQLQGCDQSIRQTLIIISK